MKMFALVLECRRLPADSQRRTDGTKSAATAAIAPTAVQSVAEERSWKKTFTLLHAKGLNRTSVALYVKLLGSVSRIEAPRDH